MNAFFIVVTNQYAEMAKTLVKSIRVHGHREDIIIAYDNFGAKKKKLHQIHKDEFKKMFGVKVIRYQTPRCPHCKPTYEKWDNCALLKFHAFTLDQYDKVLILDADTLLLDSVSELFHQKEKQLFTLYSHTVDKENIGLSSAVTLISPNFGIFRTLCKIATLEGITDKKWTNVDEGIFRALFSNYKVCRSWREEHKIERYTEGVGTLPSIYNTSCHVDFGKDVKEKEIKIFHFCTPGLHKPSDIKPESFNKILDSIYFYKKYYDLRDRLYRPKPKRNNVAKRKDDDGGRALTIEALRNNGSTATHPLL